MKHFGVEKFKGLLFASTLAVAVEFLMTLTDSVVGGHLLGEQALAGIGLANAQSTLITFLSMLLGAGTAINFFLGAFIGCALSVFEFYIRDQVIKNHRVFGA